MNLLRHGFLIAALAAVACGGGDDDDRPKFMGGKTGGRTGSGGKSGSGGNNASGGRTGDGGAAETGGADGGPGGSGGAGTGGAGGSGGSGGSGETGGAGGAVVEPTCTLSTGNEICDGCIHSDCSFQCAACEGNEACTSILDCVLTTCTSGFTGQCVNACRAQHPDGDRAFNDVVFTCGQQACSSFCPFAP